MAIRADSTTVVEDYAKRNRVEIGCGFFDQPDLQSLNDYRFFFFICDCNFKTLGRVLYSWKGILKTFPLFKTFPRYITCLQIPKFNR